MKRLLVWQVLLVSLMVVFVSSCSIQKLAVNVLADTLAGDGGSATVFMTDNDPEFVGDALPFTIKLYELLLEQNPTHEGLLRTTGSLYVMYANAFVWSPAELLPIEKWEEQRVAKRRAKNFYLRGRDYLLDSINMKYPGFEEAALVGKPESFFPQMTVEDVDSLYWLGASWFGAYSLDAFDVELGIGASAAAKVLLYAYEMNPEYNERTLDEFLISFHAAAPANLGGDPELVPYHFERVVELRGEESIGPYLAYAQYAINTQNGELFIELVQKALSIPIEEYPESLLLNTIQRRKAQHLWDTREDLFFDI
jgi:predicted anti-sigma-YlaC factor YlaD